MLQPEMLNAVGQLIEKFGFPVFVALCGLVFFWQMFSYMKTTVTKKDCDFMAYIETTTKDLADHVARRDEQLNKVIENHNTSFRENTGALVRLSDSIEHRIDREIRKEVKDDQKEKDEQKGV